MKIFSKTNKLQKKCAKSRLPLNIDNDCFTFDFVHDSYLGSMHLKSDRHYTAPTLLLNKFNNNNCAFNFFYITGLCLTIRHYNFFRATKNNKTDVNYCSY